MGIIAKQGLRNVYSTYLGFIIGGIYTALIVPKAFSDNLEYWGLARLFLSYSMIIIPWVQLSVPNIISRYFPIQNKRENNDMLATLFFWLAVSLVITSSLIFISPSYLFDDDVLIKSNLLLLIPIILGYILFEVLSALSKAMLKSTLPVFLKEFVYRLLILVLVLLYWYDLISFNGFILFFSMAYLIILIPLLISVISQREESIRFSFPKLNSSKNKEYYKYGFFIMLSGGAGIFMLNIDNVMIENYLSLSDITVYSTWFFVASFLNIPTRAITAVATPIISKEINNNDLSQVKAIFSKSSLVPLTLSLLIFFVFYLNIDLFSVYLGDKFSYAKVVFVFIGLGNLVNIASGLNGTIIILSKHFKSDLIFQFLMIIVIIITNIILIPMYGISGAALATAISVVFINVLRLTFIYKKFKMHPFEAKTFYLLFLGLLAFFAIYFLELGNNLIYHALATLVFSLLYTFVIYKLDISEDINNVIRKYLKIIGIRL